VAWLCARAAARCTRARAMRAWARFIGARVPWLGVQGTHAERGGGRRKPCLPWTLESWGPGPGWAFTGGSGSAAGPGGDGSGLRARPVREGESFFF
jgi:hypothetical protein